MNNIILVLNIIIINIKLFNSSFIPQSPCPHIFNYIEKNNEIQGIIVINNIEINKNNIVEIKVTNDNGWGEQYLNVIQDRQTIFNNIKSGNPIFYNVKFLSSYTIPEVIEIRSNGFTICKNPKIFLSGYSIITNQLKLEETKMHFSLSLNNLSQINDKILKKINDESNNSFNYQLNSEKNSQSTNQQTNLQSILQSSFENNGTNRTQQKLYDSKRQKQQQQQQQQQSIFKPSNYNEFIDQTLNVCGTTTVSIPLIIGGENFQPGAWPWLVVIFRKSKKSFDCGGTLISHQIILTAAHCVSNNKNFNDYIIGIGVHDLRQQNEEGSIYSNVKNIILHPEYNQYRTESYADIAIIILETYVQYNKKIRPICLWNNSFNLNNIIINRNGLVAGWGFSNPEIKIPSSIPSIVQSKIVSDSNCLRSNIAFIEITSNTTFCAGLRNGNGPCNGDSGSGLMFENNGRWYLRGIVSKSIFHLINSCNLDNYIVYVDVAKFLYWIQPYMTSY